MRYYSESKFAALKYYWSRSQRLTCRPVSWSKLRRMFSWSQFQGLHFTGLILRLFFGLEVRAF